MAQTQIAQASATSGFPQPKASVEPLTRFVTNYQPGLVLNLPRMVMPGAVPIELRDQVPTRDKAPPSQQVRKLDLGIAGQTSDKPSSRLEQLAAGGVMSSKDEFWQELKQISQAKKKRPQTGYVGGSNEGSSTQHGQQWINFELHEAELEAKVRRIAQVEALKTQMQIKKELDDRTKNMRDFVSTQVKASQLSIDGLRDDMKYQASMTQSQLGALKDTASRQSRSVSPSAGPEIRGHSKEDLPTQTIKASMLDDVKEALAAERLDCRPIKGHDYPLSQHQQQRGNRMGLGGAALVEVLNLDTFDPGLDRHPQKAKLTDDEKMLQMLLPTQLKAPQMIFIEEDDIAGEDQLRASCQSLPQAPLTGFQKVRLNKKEFEEEQAVQDAIPADERERTIRCLLKVMNYELDGVKSQFTGMQSALQKNDEELAEYQRQLDERQNQLKIHEMKRALEETKRIAGGYKGHSKDYVREDDNGEVVLVTDADVDEDDAGEEYDISELIADNRILLDRVGQLLDGGDEDTLSTRRSIQDSGEVESLTSSLVDGLFKQIKNAENYDKKQNGGNKKKKPTNFVGSKKQVVTYERQARPATGKKSVRKPSAKSRLFDYERSHQSSRSGKTHGSGGQNKSVTFADHSMDAFQDSVSSTQAQLRQMKAMQEIKNKGQSRLTHFNQKLEHVREAERISNQKKKAAVDSKNKPVEDIDIVLDKEISVALNGIHGALTHIYKK